MKKSYKIIFAIVIILALLFSIIRGIINSKEVSYSSVKNESGEELEKIELKKENLLEYAASQSLEVLTTEIKGQEFKLVVANTVETRTRGLSYITEMSENQGMIFVFDAPGKHLFWMKGMNFNLDIIWLDENRVITHIENNLSPETFPDSFGPDNSNTKYVIELNSGLADKLQLAIGDKLSF